MLQTLKIMLNNRDSQRKQFLIRRAEETDIPGIMSVMNEARNDEKHPDWFVPDNERYIRNHLNGNGYVIVAESTEGGIAGFFLIKYP